MERLRLVASDMEFEALATGPPSGDPILLLHGFPADAASWRPVAARLARAGHRVVAPLQRGYSPLARPLDRHAYRVDALVNDALGLATCLGWRRFHLCGHDWGGAVAWAAAAREPARLRSLTVVSTPHPAALIGAMSGSQGLRSLYMAFFRLPAAPELLLATGAGVVLERALLATGLDRNSARRYARSMGRPGALTAALNWYRAVDRQDALATGSIACPTLYVWGEQDVALGRTAAEATGDHVDGRYRFAPLPEVGHWIPERHPKRLAELIIEHIATTAQRHRPTGRPTMAQPRRRAAQ